MAARTRTQLVGRGDVMAEVSKLLYTPLANNPPLILLEGEEGIGKSVVLRNVALDARARGYMVITGRGQASEIPQPFHVLQQMLNSLKSERAEEQSVPQPPQVGAVGLMGTFGRERRSTVPMLLLPIGSTMESSEERESRLLATLSGRESDKEEEQMALFDRLADHFEDAALERKLLISIDDIHYSDRASMEFIDYFSRRIKGHSIRMIATIKPEGDLPESIGDIVKSMSREGLAHKITLARLTEKESYEFIEKLSGGHKYPPETLREWYAMSNGNPLMLEQISRTVHQPGKGEEAAGGGKPRTIEMNPEERKMLSYAAVMGKTFRFTTLHRALGGDEEKLTETIDSFIQRGLLRDKGEEMYQFASEEVWAETYNSLTDRHRRILHGKIASAIENEGEGESLTIFELANHFHLAKNMEKSVKYNQMAADISKKSRDSEAAVHFLDQALQGLRALGTLDKKLEESLVLDLALSLDTTGNVERAIITLKEIPQSGLVTLHLARLHTHAGRWKEAETIIAASMQTLKSDGDPVLLGMAYRTLGSIATYGGKYEDALRCYTEAVAQLTKAGLRAEAASAKLLLAEKKRMLSDVSEQEIKAGYEDVITELRDLNSPSLLTSALMNYGLWYAERDMLADAVFMVEEALKEATSNQDARLEGWCQFNLGDILYQMGDTERAHIVNEQARQNLERVGDKLGLIQVYLVAGRIKQRNGNLAGAEIEILEAFRLAQEVGFEPDRLEVLFRQGELYLAKGDKGAAKKRLEELVANHFDRIRPDLKREIDRFKESVEA